MIDDVEARFAARIVGAADVEQHRKAGGFEGFQLGANLARRDPDDPGIGDIGPNGGRVGGGRPGRGSL